MKASRSLVLTLCALFRISEGAQLLLKSATGDSASTNTSVVEVAADPLADCFVVPDSICLSNDANQQFILGPSATLSDLVLWYDFDKNLPVDESGHQHHLTTQEGTLAAIPAGPGILGRGSSAAFDGRSYGLVKSSEALESSCFTVSLWLYLLEDSVGSWRTIFHKGSAPDQLEPALLLWPDDRRLHVRVSTRADWNEGVLESAGTVPLRRWTHLSVTSTGSVLRLYINGVKDGEVILEGAPATSNGDLHIGRDPWRAGTKAYIDDFRWYNRELSSGEIKAMTFPSLTGIGSDFVRLGCPSCTFPDAVKSCGEQGHLCSLQELFSGGFHTARVMGWLKGSAEVWYHNEEQQDEFNGVRKMGLCCETP